ncbi:hypothetical protein Isop_1422 [Isosphaera pallida ATCC 43644]|uniref:NHLP bacteriocin system secretion protein n=1 Tax=Isosphaera pallida (strain ATCC 43644 / DSM 9630 / IS1B) TaxID=575540 RepID=E8QY17_ISOPI|nr:hypothetical protein [Isosphaera pallida]ADV62007.1 hypothetical protein Isop_1422 [Isosphaera pallida ATCC 43644]
MPGGRRILESDLPASGVLSADSPSSPSLVPIAAPTTPGIPASQDRATNARQIELHHPEAFEQLDGLLTLSTTRPWLIVALLTILTVLTLVFSLLYEVPTKVHGRGLLLVDPDSLAQVVAPAGGILIEVHLREGQRIRRTPRTGGFEVVEPYPDRSSPAHRPAFAVLAQEDLLDQVEEKRRELERARWEDAQLTRQEHEREQRQTQAKRKREETLKLLIELADRRIALSREQMRALDLLMSRDARNVNRQEYLAARIQLDQAENERGQALSELSQLEYEFLKEKDQRSEEQLKRQLAIARLEDECRILEARHGRKSLVTFVDLRQLDAQGNPVPSRSVLPSGEETERGLSNTQRTPLHVPTGTNQPEPEFEEYHVHAILKSVGAKVEEGQPIALLERIDPDQSEPRRNDLKVALVFVPTEDGKRIRPDQEVEISPTTIRRVEYGYIRGRVVNLSNLPATEDAVLSRLKHPALVSKFLQGSMGVAHQVTGTPGVFTLVTIELARYETLPFWVKPDGSNWVNRLVWSSRSGNAQVVEPWTLCDASIKVKSQPLLSLVLPWLKRETQLEPPVW